MKTKNNTDQPTAGKTKPVVRNSVLVLATFDDSFTGVHRARIFRDWLNKFDRDLRSTVRYEDGKTIVWIVSGIVGAARIERAKAIAKFAEHIAEIGW